MRSVRFSKRHFLAVFAGIGTIVLVSAITSTIFFLLYLRWFSVMHGESLFTQQPYLSFRWAVRGINYLTLILGGYVAGRMMKERGLLYGAMVGLFLTIISISISITASFLPTSLLFGPQFPGDEKRMLINNNLLGQLIDMPFTLVLTTVGGYIGERFGKRNRGKD